MFVQWKGRRVRLSVLCREHGIDRRTVSSRLARGMTLQQALIAPKRDYPDGVKRAAGSRPETSSPADAAQPNDWLRAITPPKEPHDAEAVELVDQLLAALGDGPRPIARLVERATDWLRRMRS